MEAGQPVRGGARQSDGEIRGILDLREGESVRVLHSGVRTILLERTGGAESTALPWDRDLVLTGDVRSFSLADLLQLVHGNRKSGFLFFTHQDHAKSVYLLHGEVVFATSNQVVDRLGECLLRAGVMSVEQLREAERRYDGDGRFGRVLVERGFLTARELWNGVKYQVEEIVRSLFSYTAGMVYLWEGEVQPDNVVRLSLPTSRLVSEGMQRRDELLKFVAALEDPKVQIVAIPEARSKLVGNERTLFHALESHSSFSDLCRHAGLDPLTAARTLQLLRLVGAVRLTRVSKDEGFLGEGDLRGHAEEVVRECVTAHVKLLAEMAAPIVALDGALDFTQRLEPVLDEARARHPQLLRDVTLGRHGELDPDLLAQRALRLPGQRVPAVCAALGELVSYLEFELRNHPRIPEPEDLLAGLEELRATIPCGAS